jgi:hypothetical protein
VCVQGAVKELMMNLAQWIIALGHEGRQTRIRKARLRLLRRAGRAHSRRAACPGVREDGAESAARLVPAMSSEQEQCPRCMACSLISWTCKLTLSAEAGNT